MNKTVEHIQNLAQLQKSVNMNIYGIYQFVLDHGIKFNVTDASFPKLGKPKECFFNAAKLVLDSFKYTYCEGFAFGQVLPVVHAWCIDVNGNVIDPTWSKGSDYIGVPFTNQYLIQRLAKTGYYGSLIDNFQEGFPLLTGKHNIHNVIHPCAATLKASLV